MSPFVTPEQGPRVRMPDLSFCSCAHWGPTERGLQDAWTPVPTVPRLQGSLSPQLVSSFMNSPPGAPAASAQLPRTSISSEAPVRPPVWGRPAAMTSAL